MSEINTKLKKYHFRSDIKTTWCKGCYNYILLDSLTEVFEQLQIRKTDINVISGIGCSSRLPLFLSTFGMHSVHGRAIPIAIGSRLTNPDITTVVTAGDGDLFSIGIAHFVHAARKNFNMTVICMDNNIYAMTKNQASPTSEIGYKGSLTPYGKISSKLNVLEFAIASNAGFVAQVFPGFKQNMNDVITDAIKFDGFAFVNVISPCVLYTKEAPNKEIFTNINSEFKHDPKDFMSAVKFATRSTEYFKNNNKTPIGIFYKNHYLRKSFEYEVQKLKQTHSIKNYSMKDIFNK